MNDHFHSASARVLAAVALSAGLLATSAAWAQIQMPDVRQMSGTPLPTSDLPDGTISVRLVRGALSNNIPNHPVELHGGDKVLTARTDENGRALFTGVPAGTLVHAVATVDGERLESQPFPVPSRGGIRLMLVASPAGPPEAAGPAPTAEPQPGMVILGGDSRFVVEMGDEVVEVYYLLDIVNAARVPVVTRSPLAFDMPPGAQSTSVLQGSAPQATANGPRVTVTGPFQPGRTTVHMAYVLPYSGSRLQVAQRLPAALESVAIIVEKAGAMQIASPQVTEHREMPASGRLYLVGGGPGLPADGVLTFELSGLPHQSTWPRTLAIGLAGLIVAVGLWALLGSAETSEGARRRRDLQARREKLFADLVRLEGQQHAGTADRARYARRRQELVAQLEQVYARLDEEVVPVVVSPAATVRRESPVAGRSGSTG